MVVLTRTSRLRNTAILMIYAITAYCLVTVGFFYVGNPRNLPPVKPPGHEYSAAVEALIPRLIWQVFFPPLGETVIKKDFLHSTDWVSMAPGYTYTMVGDFEAANIIETHFQHRPEIAATFRSLVNPALRSDFLRYLLLLTRGGVYSDVDTKPVVKLEDWIPAERRATTRLIVAFEYNEAEDPHPRDFTYPVQFCQWTMAAAPNHTVLARMVKRAMTGLHDLAAAQGTTLGAATFSEFDILNTTGPVAWTEVVFKTLQEADPTIKDYADLAGIRSPRYIGDMAVLPLESFRADYLDDWGWSWRKGHRALVQHFFEGGWKAKPGS